MPGFVATLGNQLTPTCCVDSKSGFLVKTRERRRGPVLKISDYFIYKRFIQNCWLLKLFQNIKTLGDLLQ